MNKTTKLCKFTAFVLAVTLVFVIAASAVFIIVETDHECEGDHCHVCANLNMCEANLKSISVLVIAIILIAIILLIKKLLTDKLYSSMYYSASPVKLKVLLLN